MKIKGLLKKRDSTEPWILDPTSDGAVDRAVHSTVDWTKGYAPDLMRTVCERSHGPKRVRVGNGGRVPETGMAQWRFA
jgi:hypothetical protein